MKKLARLLFLLPFIAGCAQSAPSTPTPQPPSQTAPADTAPTPETVQTPTSAPNAFAFEQNHRLGRGVNLGNALEAPKEGEWGVVLEEEFFARIKEGGFQSIRVPIRWNAHALDMPPYTIETAFFERVDWVLAQAHEQGLNVILNIHHYNELIEDPDGHKDRFLAIWRQIAERYQNEPNSVYFELLNEPHGHFSDSGGWNRLLAEAIPVVRQSNPSRIIIIGPGNWNAFDQLPRLVLPEDDRNIIVTFHYYQPFHFTHQGAEWADGSEAWMGTTWTGSAREKEELIRHLDAAAAWAEKNNRPLFLGEFGAYSKADMESRARWTAFLARQAEERGISWAYWEFCAGFGVYDRQTQDWVAPIYQALIPDV